jgi:hypothetical protein
MVKKKFHRKKGGKIPLISWLECVGRAVLYVQIARHLMTKTVPSRMASIGINEYRHLGVLCSTLQDRRIHLSSFIAPNIIAAMREEILRSRPEERLLTPNRSAKDAAN